MTDLPTGDQEMANQLRSLGEAVQAAVEPVTVDEAQSATPAASPTDIGLTPSPRPAPLRSGPRRSGRVLAIAASVIVLVAAVFVVTRTDNGPAELDTATASQDDEAPDDTAQDDRSVIYDDGGWAELRFCESTDIYDIDTGNSFYGAYQFTRDAWRDAANTIGLEKYADLNPAHAPPAVQDAVANAIYLERGVGAWPVCGRFLTGPMDTPVVPQLLGTPNKHDPALMVFVQPEATQSEIDSVRNDIEARLGPRDIASIEYVDQQDAYTEFLSMSFEPAFMASISAGLTPAEMPSSFRLPIEVLNRTNLDSLEDNPAVFGIVDRSAYLQNLHRLVIPALDVDVAIGEHPTLDVLQSGVAVQQSAELTDVIVGRAGGDDAPFRDLSQLRTGDRVEIHTIVDERRGMVFIQHLEVRLRSDVIVENPLPTIDDDDFIDSLNWRGADGFVLVANDASDPLARLIVRLNPVVLDTATYRGSD